MKTSEYLIGSVFQPFWSDHFLRGGSGGGDSRPNLNGSGTSGAAGKSFLKLNGERHADGRPPFWGHRACRAHLQRPVGNKGAAAASHVFRRLSQDDVPAAP